MPTRTADKGPPGTLSLEGKAYLADASAEENTLAEVNLLFEREDLPRIRRALCKRALAKAVDSTTRSAGCLHCLADAMVRERLNFQADKLGLSSLGVIDPLLPMLLTSTLQTTLSIAQHYS